MFTGLIETIGTITGVRRCGRSVELRVRADADGYRVEAGGSVAVDGVCLTAWEVGEDGAMAFTAVAETLRRTTLDLAVAGRRVNLERALRVDGRLDGHFVLGHVDAVGRIVGDEPVGVSVVRTIEFPRDLSPFIAEKGSVAIDGISLTVASVDINAMTVSLIPATVDKTTMSAKKPGDAVNVECDVLSRYMYRMMTASVSASESLADKMERLGF